MTSPGRVFSVNVAKSRTVTYRGRPMTTGIFKEPAAGPLSVGPLGLEGDFIADPRYHGGPDKAVYAYAAEDYAWWEEQLGRKLAPGLFGENLTLSGIDLCGARVGDVLKVGGVTLEAREPRLPCSRLGMKMGDARFIKRFLKAERWGVYFGVLKPGLVRAGDAALWESRAVGSELIVAVGRRKS